MKLVNYWKDEIRINNICNNPYNHKIPPFIHLPLLQNKSPSWLQRFIFPFKF
jgi:hypothetical protein